MKFSTLFVIVPALAALAQAASIPPRAQERAIAIRQNNRNGGNRGGNRGGGRGGNNGNNGGNNNGGAASTTTTAAPAATSAANNGGNNNNNNNGGNNGNAGGNTGNNGGNNNGGGGGDAQSSLTLDPGVIQPALANNGQEAGAEAGQVPSLTSTNNFINFCLTTGQPLTNGQQLADGSCNAGTIGQIPSAQNVPRTKFQSPKNFDEIPANQAFDIVLNIQGLNTGFFSNPANTYYAAPIQLGGNGQVNGHSHVVTQRINGFDDTNPPDPNTFQFFKGLNAAAQGGALTANVDKGLTAGTYRVCSITTAGNHQMILGPKAQRGAFDDCTYFKVV